MNTDTIMAISDPERMLSPVDSSNIWNLNNIHRDDLSQIENCHNWERAKEELRESLNKRGIEISLAYPPHTVSRHAMVLINKICNSII